MNDKEREIVRKHALKIQKTFGFMFVDAWDLAEMRPDEVAAYKDSEQFRGHISPRLIKAISDAWHERKQCNNCN